MMLFTNGAGRANSNMTKEYFPLKQEEEMEKLPKQILQSRSDCDRIEPLSDTNYQTNEDTNNSVDKDGNKVVKNKNEDDKNM